MSIIKTWSNDLAGLFFPKMCVLCQQQLFSNEQHICATCQNDLPQTNFKKDYNALEQKMLGRFDYQHVLAMYYFNTDSAIQKILHQIKYKKNNNLAVYMGALLAQKFAEELSEIDVLVPIPLHKKRIDQRGYNQSLLLAMGLSSVLNIPIELGAVLRTKNTETQTKKSLSERMDNMKNAFVWQDVAHLNNKKICLIDDVITTGSTIESCIECAPKGIQSNFSVLSLAAVIES